MFATFVVLVFITLFVLRIYTHHGEKIPITKLIDMEYNLASTMAEKDGFEVIVSDSVFVVGKKGGIILAQNPEQGTFTKKVENIRYGNKVFTDMIPVSSPGTIREEL